MKSLLIQIKEEGQLIILRVLSEWCMAMPAALGCCVDFVVMESLRRSLREKISLLYAPKDVDVPKEYIRILLVSTMYRRLCESTR